MNLITVQKKTLTQTIRHITKSNKEFKLKVVSILIDIILEEHIYLARKDKIQILFNRNNRINYISMLIDLLSSWVEEQ